MLVPLPYKTVTIIITQGVYTIVNFVHNQFTLNKTIKSLRYNGLLRMKDLCKTYWDEWTIKEREFKKKTVTKLKINKEIIKNTNKTRKKSLYK